MNQLKRSRPPNSYIPSISDAYSRVDDLGQILSPNKQEANIQEKCAWESNQNQQTPHAPAGTAGGSVRINPAGIQWDWLHYSPPLPPRCSCISPDKISAAPLLRVGPPPLRPPHPALDPLFPPDLEPESSPAEPNTASPAGRAADPSLPGLSAFTRAKRDLKTRARLWMVFTDPARNCDLWFKRIDTFWIH